MTSRTRHSLIALLAICQAAYALIYFIPFVSADQWDLVPILDQFFSGKSWVADVFDRHGDHMHSSAYLVMLLLAKFSHWNLLWESVAMLVINAVTFWLLYPIIIRPIINDNTKYSSAIVFIIALMFFSLSHAGNLIWTWQLAVYTAVFGAVLCISALCRSNLGTLAFASAALGALISSFSFSCGFVLWPIGLTIIALKNELTNSQKLSFSIIWLIISAAVFIYFFKITSNEFSQNIDFSIIRSITFLLYALGTPIAYFSRSLSLVIASMGLIYMVYLCIKLRKDIICAKHTLPITAVGFTMFGIGSILLISLGRLELGFDQARSFRYIIFSQFFWIGLAALHWWKITQSAHSSIPAQSKTHSRFSFTITVLSITLIAFTSQKVARSAARYSEEYTAGVSKALNTSPKELRSYLSSMAYPSADKLNQYLNVLEDKKLNLYRLNHLDKHAHHD